MENRFLIFPGQTFFRGKMLTREDGLAITNISDFADYVLSLSSLSGIENASADILMSAFEKKYVGGILYVPKEYGIFICS